MHNETTSRHIRSATELFIMVPIKHAFVPITEVVMTYAARVSTVLKALAELRQHKVERGFGDPVGPIELLETIYRVQWTVIEPFDDVGAGSGQVTRQLRSPQIVLTSHFDSSWEDYFYELVTTGRDLLDLIFSHCEGYEGSSCKDGYEAFAGFIRRHQRPCNFMYAASPEITIDDIRYFTRLQTQSITDPAQVQGFNVPPVRVEAIQTPVDQLTHDERTRSALRGVHGLYDLGRRLFSDAEGLKTAERSWKDSELYDNAIRSVLEYEPDLGRLRTVLDNARLQAEALGIRHAPSELLDAADWANKLVPKRPTLPEHPPLRVAHASVTIQPEPPPETEVLPLLADIQANILTGYRDVQAGKLLLFQCTNAEALRKLLRRANGAVTTEAKSRRGLNQRDARINLGITYSGFKLLELPARVLEEFPREFREGMAERAGMIGDVAHNHPAAWRLPLREGGLERVHLSAIHVAMTVLGDAAVVAEMRATWRSNDDWELVHILDLDPTGQSERSQPVPPKHYRPADAPEPSPLDEVPLGEFLLGYNKAKRIAGCADPNRDKPTRALFTNGTFLAMRKMQQDQAALDAYVEQVVKQICEASSPCVANPPSALRDEIRALIVGRKPEPDGGMLGALQPSAGVDANAFDFSKDPSGNLCPYHSHIRRANPRTDPQTDPTPRIVRRGLPYTPETRGPEQHEQGLLFMAYCASLAEQYEIVQRWVNGGNSTGLLSRQNDLLCGAPLDADFPRFVSLAGTSASQLGDAPTLISLPARTKPFVTLRWGLYLFAPSLSGMRWLTEESAKLQEIDTGAVARGKARIDEIAAMPGDLRMYEWKRILEEVPEAGSAQARHAQDIAAAITAAGGALVIQADRSQDSEARDLVVVTTEELAHEVLSQDQYYSVSEYRKRLNEAVQDHYLGYDVSTIDETTGRNYAQQSTKPNQEVKKLTGRAFKDAYVVATEILDKPDALELDPDRHSPDGTKRSTISVRDLASAVVAKLCHTWLDMPGLNGKDDTRALMDSLDRFLVASRYCFQAQPVEHLQTVARANREAIARDYERVEFTSQVAQALASTAPSPSKSPGSFSGWTEDSMSNVGDTQSVRRVARPFDLRAFQRMAVIGAVGFAPPAVGAITRVLDQWIETEELWQIQQLGRSNPDKLLPAIWKALGKTPAPPTLYRTATMERTLGDITVREGARVIVNLGAVYADASSKGSSTPQAWFFGGQHGGAERIDDNPPHGCPAQEAGGLVMAGIIAALLQRTSLKRERRLLLSYEVSAPK